MTQNFKPIRKPIFYQEKDTFVVKSDYKQVFSARELLSKLEQFRTKRQEIVSGLDGMDKEIKEMERFEGKAKEIRENESKQAIKASEDEKSKNS